MPGTLKVGGNIIASHTGVEGAGTVTLGNVVLGDSAVPTNNYTFRNKLINGNFDIWQRGTSQTSNDYGSVDRWGLGHATSSKTASQQSFANGQTDVPNNPKYYLRNVITSSSGGYVYAGQPIEGVETLAGKTATLSFYAKADANKNIATEFTQYFGSGGSPSSQILGIGVTTHNLTTSWQKFTVTTTIPSISGKTIGTNSNDCLSLNFWFEAGSSFNSRTNSLGNQSGTFDIAQVQLEEGPVATPFEHRPLGLEQHLCERYYEIVHDAYSEGHRLLTAAWTTTESNCFIPFKTRKRATTSNVTYTGSMQLFNGGWGNITGLVLLGSAGHTGVTLNIQRSSALVARSVYFIRNGKITVDAEL